MDQTEVWLALSYLAIVAFVAIVLKAILVYGDRWEGYQPISDTPNSTSQDSRDFSHHDDLILEDSFMEALRTSISAALRYADISPERIQPPALSSSKQEAKRSNPNARVRHTSSLESIKSIVNPLVQNLTRRISKDRLLKRKEDSVTIDIDTYDLKFWPEPPKASGKARLTEAERVAQLSSTTDQTYEWNLPTFGRVRLSDHCPEVFRNIRQSFGISLAEIDHAFKYPLQLKKSHGKSEAVFLESKCRRYFLKSLRGSEPDSLKSFLLEYMTHMRTNGDSLLPRYLGMFTFEKLARYSGGNFRFPTSAHSNESKSKHIWPYPQTGRYTFILTTGAFYPEVPPIYKFDFKGANVGRHAFSDKDELLAFYRTRTTSSNEGESTFDSCALKELDFCTLFHNKLIGKFILGKDAKEKLMKKLSKDTELLKKYNFMDYSLLIGVCSGHARKNESNRPMTMVYGDSGTRNFNETAKASYLSSAIASVGRMVRMDSMSSIGLQFSISQRGIRSKRRNQNNLYDVLFCSCRHTISA